MLSLPDGLHFVAVVTMGYPAGEDPGAVERTSSAFTERRRPRGEVVHWERWRAG